MCCLKFCIEYNDIQDSQRTKYSSCTLFHRPEEPPAIISFLPNSTHCSTEPLSRADWTSFALSVLGEVNGSPIVFWKIESTFTIRSEISLTWFPFDSQEFLMTICSIAVPTSKIQLFADIHHNPMEGFQTNDNFDMVFVGTSAPVCSIIYFSHNYSFINGRIAMPILRFAYIAISQYKKFHEYLHSCHDMMYFLQLRSVEDRVVLANPCNE